MIMVYAHIKKCIHCKHSLIPKNVNWKLAVSSTMYKSLNHHVGQSPSLIHVTDQADTDTEETAVHRAYTVLLSYPMYSGDKNRDNLLKLHIGKTRLYNRMHLNTLKYVRSIIQGYF